MALRAADGTDLGPRRQKIIDALDVKEVIAELTEQKVMYGDCFTKEDLVDRLLAARAAQANGGLQLNMPYIQSGVPMVGQSSASTQYYVLNASFLDSPHPYDILQLMVDTSSPTSIVADDVANRHAAKETGVKDPSGAWYQVDMGRMGLSEQDTGARLQPVVANIPVYPGLLGLDFFASYDVLFDFAGQRCVLYPAGVVSSLKVVSGMAPTAISELVNGRWAIEGFAHLEGKKGAAPIQMVLDTGAMSSVMNWAAAETLGLTPDSPQIRKKGFLKDAGKPLAEMETGFTLGAETTPVSRTISIADLPGFIEMQLEDRPAMILGADVLQSRGQLVLSAIGGLLWLPQDH